MSLWRIDGTTEKATRIWRGAARWMDIQEVDGVFLFAVRRARDAATLWVTDGTRKGTAKITTGDGRRLRLGLDTLSDTFDTIVRTGDRLLFYADDGKRGLELWALAVPGS